MPYDFNTLNSLGKISHFYYKYQMILACLSREIAPFLTIEKNISSSTYYRIYSAIRRGFHLSRMTTNNLISSM